MDHSYLLKNKFPTFKLFLERVNLDLITNMRKRWHDILMLQDVEELLQFQVKTDLSSNIIELLLNQAQ